MDRSHNIDIGGLLSGSGRHMLVEDGVPIEAFEGATFPEPAQIRLELGYANRLLTVDGSVDVRVLGECARCLERVDATMHVEVTERFDPFGGELDPFADANVVEGERLDVRDLAQQNVLSAMPMGLLCSDTCRGLCSRCGANKNAGACSCEPLPEAT